MQSQSIDGDMIVAGDDELPAGYFVKAAGYLPGDVITLTNSYTGEDIEFLNVGTLDGSGGIAMIISKEGAQKLGMSRASSKPIRLEPRGGSYDESASGKTVVSKASSYRNLPDENVPDEDDFLASKRAVETPSPADELIEEKIPAEETVSLKESEPEEKEPAPDVITEAPSESEKPEEPVEDISEAFSPDELPPDTEEKPLTEPEPEPEENEPASDVAAEEPSEPEKPEEPAEDNSEAFSPDELPPDTEEKPLPEPEPEENEPASDIAPEEPSEPERPEEPAEDNSEAFNPDELSDVEEEKPQVPEKVEGDLPGEEVKAVEPESNSEEYFEGEPESGDLFEDEQPSEIEETPSEEKVDETVSEEPPAPKGELTEDLPGEEVLSVEPAPVVNIPETKTSPDKDYPGESVSSKEPVPVPSEDLPGEEVLAVEPSKVPSKDLDGEKVDSKEPVYEGIVLVPASPLPPPETEEEIVAEPEPEMEPEAEPESELIAEPEPEPVEEPVEEPVKESSSREEDIVSSRLIKEADLKKGAFYIQIATFSKRENAANVISSYSKYPVCVIENANGTYKVLAGPLNEDEYGAVLLRFKSFGFKDAFVKRIK